MNVLMPCSTPYTNTHSESEIPELVQLYACVLSCFLVYTSHCQKPDDLGCEMAPGDGVWGNMDRELALDSKT